MATLTKAEMTQIRSKLDAALAELVKTNPKIAQLRLGNATFSPEGGTFTFKLDGMVVGGLTKEAQRYDLYTAHNPKYPKRDKKIRVIGKVGFITGMNQTGTKAMFTEFANGKSWLIDKEALLDHIEVK